jgi:hypothetical protein
MARPIVTVVEKKSGCGCFLLLILMCGVGLWLYGIPTLKTKSGKDSVELKVADLKSELAAIEIRIQAERSRWQEAVNLINRLTNFKRTPVSEGSPQYHECMAASRVIKEVEEGAPALKGEKARLESMIQTLDKQ